MGLPIGWMEWWMSPDRTLPPLTTSEPPQDDHGATVARGRPWITHVKLT